jgi:hypothetical protein
LASNLFLGISRRSKVEGQKSKAIRDYEGLKNKSLNRVLRIEDKYLRLEISR